MYNTDEFLERYREFEEWSNCKYGNESLKEIEKNYTDYSIQQEIRYFKGVRNVLTHNPNGDEDPYIILTDAFKVRFERLCTNLMGRISNIYIPRKDIYMRQMSDKILPTISFMKKQSYSYVPVMNGKKVWGVFSEAALFEFIGEGNASTIDDKMQLFKMSQYITKYSKDGSYDFAGESSTINDIRDRFSRAFKSGRRLDIILITNTGDMQGDLQGLISVWDMTSL